jgi:hypothetical protein
MPFGWTDFRHRLNHAIFRREILRQLAGEVADFVKAGKKFLR